MFVEKMSWPQLRSRHVYVKKKTLIVAITFKPEEIGPTYFIYAFQFTRILQGTIIIDIVTLNFIFDLPMKSFNNGWFSNGCNRRASLSADNSYSILSIHVGFRNYIGVIVKLKLWKWYVQSFSSVSARPNRFVKRFGIIADGKTLSVSGHLNGLVLVKRYTVLFKFLFL